MICKFCKLDLDIHAFPPTIKHAGGVLCTIITWTNNNLADNSEQCVYTEILFAGIADK